MRLRFLSLFLASTVAFSLYLAAQTETATLSGYVSDPDGQALVGAGVEIVNVETGLSQATRTNKTGLYLFPNVHPGKYRISVRSPGFKEFVKQDLTLHVQDTVSENFKMQIGSISESVTVVAGTPTVNTEDATVSTVIDRNFAENLPMNGRSFQTLIQLTPGVVSLAVNSSDAGQFSFNGQRGVSNYWMVDGVSANIGSGASFAFAPGSGFSGSVGSFSAQGGTNSLVSVDAMQEFRIQTSTYAPEFGRTPGGQISIVTRSGTNQFHGTIFDYFRNDVLDANDWFNGYTNNPPLPKAEERQNDFGGTLGGPIRKEHTFFFFSYEGLRLRLPQTQIATVPDLAARQSAVPALQPYFNAYPRPNGPDLGNGVAQFNTTYSNSSTLDAYSLRIDHKISDKLNVFGRYDYSPSQISIRGFAFHTLSVVTPIENTTQTGTLGATWMLSSTAINDLRFNYSRVRAATSSHLDNFGGAVPLKSVPFPSPFTVQNSEFDFDILPVTPDALVVGKGSGSLQRQLNVVDNVSFQRGAHAIKFGVDYRRLSPNYEPFQYYQNPVFLDMPSAEAGNAALSQVAVFTNPTILIQNLGLFVQDTWRVHPRLTLTYGLRWDVDFAPTTTSGPTFPAAINFNDLPNLTLAPNGTPAFKTPYGNVAPRLGVAYELSQNPTWRKVVRGGLGVFYDLATSEVGNIVGQASYPFNGNKIVTAQFPFDAATASPPAINPSNLATGTLSAFYPHFQLPYTLEWNVAFEEGLGSQQTISASYVGAAGRRLIISEFVSPIPSNPSIAQAQLITNAGSSDYNALQLQFQRRLSRGLQVLASYSWSHSIDTGSAGSIGALSNTLVPGLGALQNRGPSDFDVRNAFSAGVTYDVPTPKVNALTNAVLRGWSLQNVLQGRSAVPVDIFDGNFLALHNGLALIRPDVVPGIPLYLYGPQYPGGKAFNNTPNQGGPGCTGPFCPPPTDASGNPLRQGDLTRNALRGFGLFQWDFSVHRDFDIYESLKLQFRAEMFNVLNHPNFAPPLADISSSQFGLSTQMLGQYLSGGQLFQGSGGFSPLYQIGAPRSIQFALKLNF